MLPTIAYTVGVDLPDLPLNIKESGVLLNLATGHTFSLKVVAAPGAAAAFTKTTNITGAAVEPNLTIQWATTGELNSLTEGLWVAELTITRTSDSRDRKRRFYLNMSAAA